MTHQYNILIGDSTAEQIKIEIGKAFPFDEVRYAEVKGRDLVVGSPKTVTVSSDEIREALVDQVNIVVDAVKQALERTPPELAADIVDKGIVLAGGRSMLANFDILIRERTGLPVMYAEDPLKCVVIGSGKVLDQLDLLKSLTID